MGPSDSVDVLEKREASCLSQYSYQQPMCYTDYATLAPVYSVCPHYSLITNVNGWQLSAIDLSLAMSRQNPPVLKFKYLFDLTGVILCCL